MVNIIMFLYIYIEIYIRETCDKILDEQRMGMGIFGKRRNNRAYMILRIVEADEYITWDKLGERKESTVWTYFIYAIYISIYRNRDILWKIPVFAIVVGEKEKKIKTPCKHPRTIVQISITPFKHWKRRSSVYTHSPPLPSPPLLSHIRERDGN